VDWVTQEGHRAASQLGVGVRLPPPARGVVVELAERVTGLLGTAEKLLTDGAGLSTGSCIATWRR
jgi:hypothetical protein